MTQDYKIPKDENAGNQVVPGWFESIDQPLPGQPDRPSKSKRTLVLLILVAVIVITALLALAARQYMAAGARCIDESEYQSIITNLEPEDTALPYDQLKKDTSIYGYTVYFSQDTAEFEAEQRSDVQTVIQKLGKIMAGSSTPPLKISLTSVHVQGTSENISKDRLEYLRRSLIQAGVADDTIQVIPPTVVVPTEEDTPENNPVFLNVTPAAICS